MSVDFTSLISRVKDREPQAQKELYDLFSTTMFNLCLRQLSTKEDAEEVFQDAFVKVFENIDKVVSPEALPGWIKRIFMNSCIDALRRRKYYVQPLENFAHLIAAPCPSDPMELNDLMARIERLPLKSRCVFMMYEIEGYNHKEIAEILKISEGTSKSQLFFAKAKLKEEILQETKIENLRLKYEF